jgi:hypothetical protein
VVRPYYLFHLEKHDCLSRDVYMTGAACRAVMRIEARVGDLVQRTENCQAQVGYSVTGRSRGRVTLCAVCTVHKETRSMGFLVQPQNQGRRSPGLTSKPVATVLVVWPQNHSLGFLGLGLKTGSCGLVIWPIKPP